MSQTALRHMKIKETHLNVRPPTWTRSSGDYGIPCHFGNVIIKKAVRCTGLHLMYICSIMKNGGVHLWLLWRTRSGFFCIKWQLLKWSTCNPLRLCYCRKLLPQVPYMEQVGRRRGGTWGKQLSVWSSLINGVKLVKESHKIGDAVVLWRWCTSN